MCLAFIYYPLTFLSFTPYSYCFTFSPILLVHYTNCLTCIFARQYKDFFHAAYSSQTALKMEAASAFKSFVITHQSTWHCIPQDFYIGINTGNYLNKFQKCGWLQYLTLRTKIKCTLFTYIANHGCWRIFTWKALHVTHAIVICGTLTSLALGGSSWLGNSLCEHSYKFFHCIFLIWLKFSCCENCTWNRTVIIFQTLIIFY